MIRADKNASPPGSVGGHLIVGVGRSSRTVRHWSWAGPIFQDCPGASAAVQWLGYSIGNSRGSMALIVDRLLFGDGMRIGPAVALVPGESINAIFSVLT